jgi:molybdenum cofactor cytidylyltransferase
MADIVESHMDLTVKEGEPVGEAEVVFLTDKLIRGERFVGLDARFLTRLEEYSADPPALAAVRSKLESARRSAARIEAAARIHLNPKGTPHHE